MLRFKQVLDRGIKGHPLATIMREDFGKKKRPRVIGLFNSLDVSLLVTDPEIVNEIYVTKNKFLDKHDSLGRALYPLMGDTMLF